CRHGTSLCGTVVTISLILLTARGVGNVRSGEDRLQARSASEWVISTRRSTQCPIGRRSATSPKRKQVGEFDEAEYEMSDCATSRGKRILTIIPWCLLVALILASFLGAQRPPARAGNRGPSHTLIAAAILDLAVVAVLVARGMDVRIVLLLGALPLFVATRQT